MILSTECSKLSLTTEEGMGSAGERWDDQGLAGHFNTVIPAAITLSALTLLISDV